MPNCDFYASATDHELLLNWLFAENTCSIYELSSIGETPLRRFMSAEEVMGEFKRTYSTGVPWHSVYLQLHVNDSGPPVISRRVDIRPEAQKLCGFRFRYACEGWGLVQLYLSVLRDGDRRLADSHTNHNTLTRAQAWESTSRDLMGKVKLWDFKKITSFSSRLNRQIRKQAVAKLGSRVVLPGALRAWNTGTQLGIYSPLTTPEALKHLAP